MTSGGSGASSARTTESRDWFARHKCREHDSDSGQSSPLPTRYKMSCDESTDAASEGRVVGEELDDRAVSRRVGAIYGPKAIRPGCQQQRQRQRQRYPAIAAPAPRPCSTTTTTTTTMRMRMRMRMLTTMLEPLQAL